MSRERVELIRAGFDAFNGGNYGAGLEGLADDVTWEVLDVFPEKGPFHGKEGVVRVWESWAETFSGFRAEIEDVIDLEDDVIVVMRMSGRAHESEAPMTTPSFAQIWTFHGNLIGHVQMVAGKDEALQLVDQRRTHP